MSLGNSNMAGNAQGTAFSLLLLASIIQGLQNVELFHYEALEAVEGQNITLPCFVKNRTDAKIASIEWSIRKHGITKLALYSPGHGFHLFRPNVTIQLKNNDGKNLTGSYLHLPEVMKWDSGVYVCDLTTFPYGSIQSETVLTVKDDIKIMCDTDGPVEVHNGENVTIRCTLYPHAQYSWTKNKKLVSAKESLELWWVTDALAGVYTLTVNTGNKSLHKEFIITVLTEATSLRTDLVTTSPQGLTESADSSLNTSATTGFLTHANVNSVRSSSATHSTASSYGRTVFKSTPETASDETRNESTSHPEDTFSGWPEGTSTLENLSENSENPDAASTPSVGTITVFEDKDAGRSHLLPLIIVPMLVLIAVAGFLYRRQMIKKRMDLPPPFKPPPPPVKYAAARQSENSAPLFPTSRCNSVAESKDMQQLFVMI
ncbi:T-cell surface protein tactile isoform X2 [Stegastes partitus]|uniref:T-cell surface protein tactile isoform X2 n=1 Tax=Stegastes partitus TaxID=144197 RepID=A0A9Y4MQT4_9TELE|nr:PREDICTED: T-cell surface protein tactile-like isoform X2 [Stegastes partitus]